MKKSKEKWFLGGLILVLLIVLCVMQLGKVWVPSSSEGTTTSRSTKSSSKKVKLNDIIVGVFDEGELTDLSKARDRFGLIITVSPEIKWIYNSKLYTLENHQEIAVEKFESVAYDDNTDAYEVWFKGKTREKYQLVLNSHDSKYEDVHYTIDFTLPDKKSSLKSDLRQIKSRYKSYLAKDVRQDTYEKLQDDDIWTNMSPYYTPTKKEKKAIADAYWKTFIKNWDNYELKITSANTTHYSIKVDYQSPEPDINLLNQKIEDRENELKKEVKGDFRQMFKKIVSELPSMIEKLPKPKATQTQTETFTVSRKNVDSTFEIDNNKTYNENIASLYP